MKLEFSIEEKQFLNIVIKDCIQGAKINKARSTVRYGNKLLDKFSPNSTYSELKLKEVDLLYKIVLSSIETIEKLLSDDRMKEKKEILETNLNFAKQFSTKLKQLFDDNEFRIRQLEVLQMKHGMNYDKE